MKLPRFTYLLLLLNFLCGGSFAQNEELPYIKPYSNIDSSILKIENLLSGKIKDTSVYVKSMCYLSALYNKKSEYVKSEKKLWALVPSLQAPKHKAALGMVYNHIANTYKLTRNLVPALQYYLKAVGLLESQRDRSNLVKCYVDIAEYYRSKGDYDDARSYIRKAFTVYHSSFLNDTVKLIRIYNRHAAIDNEHSVTDSSLYFSLKALDLARRIGDKNLQAISLNEIGYTYKNQNLVDTSMKCYQRAVALWTEVGADADAVHGLFNQALLLSHNFYPKRKVIPYYEKIIRKVKEKKIDYPLDQVYYELSNCYYFLGDSLHCYTIRDHYYKALLRKLEKNYNSEVNNIKEKYENQKYKLQISKVSDELLHAEKTLKQKKRENLFIYVSLALMMMLIAVIALLTRRVSIANNILKTKNKEKDSLIQEIHHRVKNNLQFVSSLINMQIHSRKNSAEIDTLNDASRRIRSMALVHEMLYNQEHLNSVEIKKYLSELINCIEELVNTKKIPIRFNLECPVLQFEPTKAIALGMITSELVSNSIKYAFENVSHPQIDISLQKSADNYLTFIVRDNGKGLDEKETTGNEKLGMRLINIFSRQIRGEYVLKNENGLVYTLQFKLED